MKKRNIKLGLKKQTISGFRIKTVVGGTNFSGSPDEQSECLCGPRPTEVGNTCRGSYCQSCNFPETCVGLCAFL